MNRTIRRRLRAFTAAAGFSALSACGGGGDGDGSGIGLGGAGILGSYFVQSFAAFETAAANLRDNASRYVVQWNSWNFRDDPGTPQNEAATRYSSYPLASSRVEYAHAAGLTGQGQTIAIVDEGFLTTHDVFSGKSVAISGSIPVRDHGTQVASVAAGSSTTMTGVAPRASLLLGGYQSRSTLAEATNRARQAGAVAQNNSWGYPLPATPSSFDLIFQGTDGLAYLNALDAYAARGVVVFAVTNSRSGAQAELMEALPMLRPSLEPGWLAVGNAAPSFDNDRILSAEMVSQDCLEAARWCIVADGAWIGASSASNASYSFATGSSFAAPQVSGALALLAEAFPNLTPHELRIRLLASADNRYFTHDGQVDLLPGPEEFLHGYSTVFGHGFLDIRAALLPIGTPAVAAADGSSIELADAVIVSGSAMGDAISRSLADVRVEVSDSLGAGFSVPGTAFVAESRPRALADGVLTDLLSSDLSAARVAATGPALAAFAGHHGRTTDFADAANGLSASILLPEEGSGDDIFGVELRRSLTGGPLDVSLGVKFGRDDGSLLGFGSGSDTGADLAALTLNLTHDGDAGGFFGLSAEIGVADVGKPAVLTDVGRVGYDSFGVTFGTRDALTLGDRIAFGVSLPTTVTSGTGTVLLPVSRGAGLPAEMRAIDVDLAPRERQVDLRLGYQMPVGKRSELALDLVHAENWGNRAGARDTGGAIAFTFRF